MYGENELKEDYDLSIKKVILCTTYFTIIRIFGSFSLVLSQTCFAYTKLDSYFTNVGFNDIPIFPQVETKLKVHD